MKMKTIYILLIAIIAFNINLFSQSSLTLEELNAQKNQAVSKEQYRLAKVIQDEINRRNSSSYNPDAEEWRKNPETVTAVTKLEAEKKEAVNKEYWTIAAQLKKDIDQKKGLNPTFSSTKSIATNKREFALQQLKKEGFRTNPTLPNSTAAQNTSVSTLNTPSKVKDATDNSIASVKYRRSSLYTLMVNDPTRPHANVIKDAFGNAPLPEKFNDHNIGPYLIEGSGTVKDRSYEITNHLNNNLVAKELVAKWFNRKSNGAFNMDLIASRGEYDASTYDKLIAASSQRGAALLADAGEDLIGNTFVIVNDFKFTNKEEVAKKASSGLKMIGTLSSYAGYDVSAYTSVAAAGATVAGKGYIIKTTSYLYRLEWNDSVAAVFYQNFWADESNIDPNKVKAFDAASLFTLKYVGSQDAWADVQSSIFTNKSEEDLIKIATVKATDQAIAKLQRKFEEFRTKTPLHSVEPLTAKIGLKEGLEPGDKFEVLESVIGLDGKISYKRKGVITVKKGMIWDNTYVPEEEKGNVPVQSIDATHFIGAKNLFYPGMLIKQIN